MEYERIEKTFQKGDALKNLNGGEYYVLEVLSQRNLLLMSSAGQYLVGCGTRFFRRTNTDGSVTEGIEWDHGNYLGDDITKINFKDVRWQYRSDTADMDEVEDDLTSMNEMSDLYNNISKLWEEIIDARHYMFGQEKEDMWKRISGIEESVKDLRKFVKDTALTNRRDWNYDFAEENEPEPKGTSVVQKPRPSGLKL